MPLEYSVVSYREFFFISNLGWQCYRKAVTTAPYHIPKKGIRASHVTLCTVCCNNATFERFPFPIHPPYTYTPLHTHWPSCIHTGPHSYTLALMYIHTGVRALPESSVCSYTGEGPDSVSLPMLSKQLLCHHSLL